MCARRSSHRCGHNFPLQRFKKDGHWIWISVLRDGLFFKDRSVMVFLDLLRTFNAAKCLVQIFYGKCMEVILFFSDGKPLWSWMWCPFYSPAVHVVLDCVRVVDVHLSIHVQCDHPKMFGSDFLFWLNSFKYILYFWQDWMLTNCLLTILIREEEDPDSERQSFALFDLQLY